MLLTNCVMLCVHSQPDPKPPSGTTITISSCFKSFVVFFTISVSTCVLLMASNLHVCWMRWLTKNHICLRALLYVTWCVISRGLGLGYICNHLACQLEVSDGADENVIVLLI